MEANKVKEKDYMNLKESKDTHVVLYMLESILALTRSQCNCESTGVMCSPSTYQQKEEKIYAVQFS